MTERRRPIGAGRPSATRTRRRAATLVFALSGLVLGGLGAPSGTAHDAQVALQPGALVQRHCHEVFPIVEVPYEAADDAVPDTYDVFRNERGNAEVFIAVRRCQSVSVGDDVVRDAIDFYITISIAEPAAKPPHASFLQPVAERDDSSTDHGLSPLEGYLLEWSTDNVLHARWLRHQTGLGDRVRVVADLDYAYQPAPGRVPGAVDPQFRFVAPRPALSPFRVDAVVTEGGPYRWDAGTNRWADTDAGTVIVFGEHPAGPDQVLAPARGTVTASDPDSPLGRLFGEQPTRPFVPELTPLLAGGFDVGQWTKCVRTRQNPCAPGDH